MPFSELNSDQRKFVEERGVSPDEPIEVKVMIQLYFQKRLAEPRQPIVEADDLAEFSAMTLLAAIYNLDWPHPKALGDLLAPIKVHNN